MGEQDSGRSGAAYISAGQPWSVCGGHRRHGGRRKAARILSAAFVTAVFLLAGLNTGRAFAAAFGVWPMDESSADPACFREGTSGRQMRMYEICDGVVAMLPLVTDTDCDGTDRIIREACGASLKRAAACAREYRRAFLAAGGTKEAFAAKRIVIAVDYDVRSCTKEILSFVVKVTENRIFSDVTTEYYNYDRKSRKMLTLADVLGSDNIEAVDRLIREQMRLREEADSGVIFWTEAEGGFATVDGHSCFYVNENNNPVVVFDKYEIAPGAMGEVQFEITL